MKNFSKTKVAMQVFLYIALFTTISLMPANATEIDKNIVPSNFYSDWNPGIPGGAPKVTTVFKTIKASDYGSGTTNAASAINAAIQAAGDIATPENKQVVQLSEGVFLINETIRMNRSNVVLRGAGIGKTFLRGIHYGSAITIGESSPQYGNDKLTAVTKDVKMNDTSIEVADAGLFKPGDILKLDRPADADVNPNGNSYGKDGVGTEWRLDLTYILRVKSSVPSPSGPPSEEYRSVAQYVEVASIRGNRLNLTNKVNINFPVSLSPQVWDTHARNFKYIGVEDMTVQGKANNNYTVLVDMTRASSYSWVKNIECDGAYPGWQGRHIEMYGFRNIVRDSYIHDSNNNAPGGFGYGICVSGTDGLVENNIVTRLCKCLQGVVSGGGNVIAYNYVPDSETVPENWQECTISASHGSYSHSDLYEGNFAANISSDATHGNNGKIVFFRNYASGRNEDGKTTRNLHAMEVAGWNREHASIGNVLLSPDLLSNSCLWSVPATVVLNDGSQGRENLDKAAVYRMGTNTWTLGQGSNTLAYGNWDNGQAYRMFYRHLDFNCVENAVYDNPDNPVKTLPNSLYLDSKPDFFGDLAWPPVNPVGSTPETRVMALPAKVRYDSLYNTPKLTDYVNPFIGTTTLWDSIDLGYKPSPAPKFRHLNNPLRAWGGETFPGATLPNAMVQVTPVTCFGSGAGYQYEDTVIYAFFHTAMGHWNLGHVPILPFTGNITVDNYQSGYSHENESARPGYYQVYLERYNINAEMTATLHCAYHKYTYRNGDDKKLLLNLSRMNSRQPGVKWDFKQVNENTFSGSQGTDGRIYFYAVANHTIKSVDSLVNNNESIILINFADRKGSLELKIGFSFVSVEKAKKNLEAEMINKNFAEVRKEADQTWETLLSKIQVTGGTEKQKKTFYSCLYRAFLWPALRSDVDGEFTDLRGNAVNKGFRYYTDPAFWDDYRNKLVLLGMLTPEVAGDIINSIIDRAKITGFMPTYFHGDHASAFVTGMYLRGLRGFDVDSAYYFMLRNATVENPKARPYLNEYIKKGWIAENNVKNPTVMTEADEAKAAVTKTLEYAYDDYAVALLAGELNDSVNYNRLMQRAGNYKNVFDPSTGFMRGRLANGKWMEPFDPAYPYYVFMYREANAWQSTFFAPHDPEGLIALYPDKKAFERKLDSLFTVPWGGYEADNMTTFIGQYCPGNQPSQGIAYMYYFVGKQEKCQAVLDSVMNRYYNMGKEGLAFAGMDDSGGLSAWYVLNAIGLYTFSPADPEYIITVPVFDRVVFKMNDTQFIISKINKGKKIKDIMYDGKKITGYFISHDDLKKGKELVITTE